MLVIVVLFFRKVRTMSQSLDSLNAAVAANTAATAAALAKIASLASTQENAAAMDAATQAINDSTAALNAAAQ